MWCGVSNRYGSAAFLLPFGITLCDSDTTHTRPCYLDQLQMCLGINIWGSISYPHKKKKRESDGVGWLPLLGLLLISGIHTLSPKAIQLKSSIRSTNWNVIPHVKCLEGWRHLKIQAHRFPRRPIFIPHFLPIEISFSKVDRRQCGYGLWAMGFVSLRSSLVISVYILGNCIICVSANELSPCQRGPNSLNFELELNLSGHGWVGNFFAHSLGELLVALWWLFLWSILFSSMPPVFHCVHLFRLTRTIKCKTSNHWHDQIISPHLSPRPHWIILKAASLHMLKMFYGLLFLFACFM